VSTDTSGMQDLSQLYLVQAIVPLAASLALLYAGAGVLLARSRRSFLSGYLTILDRRPSAFAVLILVSLFFAANQMIVRGVAAGIWDADGQFFPYFVLVADHARAGRFVTWDLWTHGGIPLMGDPQVGAFSPLTVFFGLVFGGTSLGFRMYWLTVWVLGALGVFALGRHLRAPAWGSLAVALGFAFCGVYLSNAQHTPWLAAYSFVPLIVWRLDVALASRRWRPAAEAGGLWGLSALAGYPGIVAITGVFCGLWALGRWAFPEQEAHLSASETPRRIPAARALGVVALLGVIGVVVFAPTYLAFFYEGAGTQPRVGALSRDEALSNQFDPGALVTLFSPYLAILKERHSALWPSSDVSMVNVYVGAAIPLLALFAVARRGAGGWRWWLVGIATLSLATAMGESLPFRGWLYDAFLPMRYFRHSAIFRLFFVFAVTVLALYGVRDLALQLRNGSRQSARRFGFVAAGVVLAAGVAFLPYVGSPWESGGSRGTAAFGRAHFAIVWLGALGLGAVVWRMTGQQARRVIPVLLVVLAGSDALLTSVVSVPTVARPGPQAERWRALDLQHVSSLDGQTYRTPSACGWIPGTRRCKRNDQLITKVPVFDAYASERNPFQQALAAHPVALDAVTGADRLWFSASPAFSHPTDQEFQAFLARTDELGRMPLVVHEPEAMLRPDNRATTARPRWQRPARHVPLSDVAAVESIGYTLRSYDARRMELDVEAPSTGWLLVTDRWARSWRTEVNDQPIPTYAANFIFRAVPLEPGLNRVHFTFAPLAYPWLGLISWATLVFLGLLPVVHRLRRGGARAPVAP
jgi:hypothetical protein